MVSKDYAQFFKSLPQTEEVARDHWVKNVCEKRDDLQMHVFSSLMAALSVGYLNFREFVGLEDIGPYSKDAKDAFFYELVIPFQDKIDPKIGIAEAAIYAAASFFTLDELRSLIEYHPNKATPESVAKHEKVLEGVYGRWWSKDRLN